MERIVVRLKDYKINKVIKKKKVFYNFKEAKEYIESLFVNLKENECVRLTFASTKYLSKFGELYNDTTKEELEYAYYKIKEWLSENEEVNS